MENSKNTPATQLLHNSLDRSLAKNMKGWSELCAEDVIAEFPTSLNCIANLSYPQL